MAPTRERRLWLSLGSIGTAVVAAFLCSVATVAAQERRLKPEYRTGSWQERVPVSGGIRVGVVVWLSGKFNPRELALSLPRLSESDHRLCVEISSRDGRYTAQLQYRIGKDDVGPIIAEIDAPDVDKLNTSVAEDVAILAGLSKDCRASSPSAYLVAAWRPARPDDTISILLNSRVPTTIVGAGDPVPCKELGGVTTAYNQRCDVAAHAIAGAELVDGTVRLNILQKRGRSQATVSLPLIVAR